MKVILPGSEVSGDRDLILLFIRVRPGAFSLLPPSKDWPSDPPSAVQRRVGDDD